MSTTKLLINNIEQLTSAQKNALVRTGIIRVEPTEAEEEMWQIAMLLLDRSYIAELLGLSVATVNTYMGDDYRLTMMKEKLHQVLAKHITQRDVTVVCNIYKKLQRVTDQTRYDALIAKTTEDNNG